MSALILVLALNIAQLAFACAMGLSCYRMIRGPRAQDRILALDSFYVSGMLQVLAFGIRSGTTLYFEIALVISVLGFVSTLSLAKFLMRGEVIE